MDLVMIPLQSDNKSSSLLTLTSFFHAFITNILFTKMHAMVSILVDLVMGSTLLYGYCWNYLTSLVCFQLLINHHLTSS